MDTFMKVNQKKIQNILDSLLDILNNYGDNRNFSEYVTKNGRDNYGKNIQYSYKGHPFMIISMNGSRTEVDYYLSHDALEVIQQIQLDTRL